jgi:hypothetical protein
MSNIVRNALTVTAAVIVLGLCAPPLHAQQRVEPFPDTRIGGTTAQTPMGGSVPTPQSCEQYDTINSEVEYQCLPPPAAPNEDTWTLIKTVTIADATLNLGTKKCDVETRIYTYKITVGKCEKRKVQKPKDAKERTKWIILFEKLTGETAKKGG